ncbi:DUF6262 family protein [Bacillus inaquosorum]|uniref:DUF6262 family protein n=1 Tax=Bacillus inaquosorum TaxID=483913 RepID=UPI002282AC76|nr:DUF6262 family protein [Bacillus inaquosorum]MCY7939601.1 DUF6262 family protein [Bacillus inaquosorum]MCY8252322.1 DUF6262 family protein [Bacillus inaquosorum]
MPNEGILILQQRKRNESIEKVNWAIQYFRDLEGPNSRITAKKLSELTQLSRTVLYKPHLRSLWDKNWHGENIKISKKNHLAEEDKLFKKIACLKAQLQKKETKIHRLEEAYKNEKNRSKAHAQNYEELKVRHQRLLHHNLMLTRKLHLHGLEYDDQPDL